MSGRLTEAELRVGEVQHCDAGGWFLSLYWLRGREVFHLVEWYGVIHQFSEDHKSYVYAQNAFAIAERELLIKVATEVLCK